MASLNSFSTSALPPGARLGAWNDISSRLFGTLRIDRRSSGPFWAEMERLPLRDCELVSLRSSPVSIFRSPESSSRGRTSSALALNLVCSGSGSAMLGGQEVQLQAGDLLLLHSSSLSCYRFDQPVHFIVVLLDAQRLAHRLQQLRPYLNRHIRPNGGAPALLSKFFLSTWEDMKEGFQPQWSGPLSDTFWGLFDLAFQNQDVGSPTPLRRLDRLHGAQQLMESGLRNPDFHVHEIAQSLHVSERYVQALFSDLGTTPSKYLLNRRLELAAERLRCEPQARISDVALSVGFNDLGYFSRAFRKRYGMPASHFRLTEGR